MSVPGDRHKRYYVTVEGREGSLVTYALREGTPDAEKPQDASKDTRDGPIVLQDEGMTFWANTKEAGYTWAERSFKRYWAFDPIAAAKLQTS